MIPVERKLRRGNVFSEKRNTMKKLFSPDSALYRIVERFTNLVGLNLLYLLFCIPIVTIGPATVALHYVTLKYAENEEERVWAPFIHSFRQNLKQGMALGVLTTGLGIFLAFDLYWIYQMVSAGIAFDMVVLVMVSLACIIYLMMTAYIFPLMARYDNSLKQMFRTAVILAIRHLPATVCMAIISAVPIVLMMYTLPTFMLAITFYFFVGFAAIAFLHDKMIALIFRQYTPKENTEE